ncbi:MAG: hypothetical protein NC399_08390 [Muribaculum sp.]|nr:hypothetical protein [Muribaculum sp.]
MNEDQKKAKRLVIGLFLSCVCIALVCFGIVAYMVMTYRSGGAAVPQRTANIATSIAMIGIFFLVLAFGYLFPMLIRSKKTDTKSGKKVGIIANDNAISDNAVNHHSGANDSAVTKETGNASEVFDETNMRRVLEKYIPDGETMLAGIHAIAKESSVTAFFVKCIPMENRLVPDETGGVIALHKKKYSGYDIYIGITQFSLLIAECQRNSYLYQVDNKPDVGETVPQEVSSDLYYDDIGTCFPLADIQSCEIKNGWMGSVKCVIAMKNGSYFKLMLPKLGGLGGGMPHHTEYRRAIIERLGGGER